MILNNDYIVLFDGGCNLCNRLVRFIIKKDRKNQFRFLTLDSCEGQSLLNKYRLSTDNLDSLVYIKGGIYYLKSAAILNISYDLGYFWKLLYVFILVPKVIRDNIYNKIASRRYTIFRSEA